MPKDAKLKNRLEAILDYWPYYMRGTSLEDCEALQRNHPEFATQGRGPVRFLKTDLDTVPRLLGYMQRLSELGIEFEIVEP